MLVPPSFLLLGCGVGSWVQRSGVPGGPAGPSRGQSQRKSTGMGSPEAVQHAGVVPHGHSRTQGGAGLGTGYQTCIDTSTPGFNWVPLPHSLFAPQEIGAGHSCSSSCQGGPGQRHWNSQSITTSLCSSLRSAQGVAPMGCPGPSTAWGDPCSQQVILPTFPPFPEQAEVVWASQ